MPPTEQALLGETWGTCPEVDILKVTHEGTATAAMRTARHRYRGNLLSFVVRARRYAQHKMRASVADAAWFMCVFVCMLVTTVSESRTVTVAPGSTILNASASGRDADFPGSRASGVSGT